MASLLLFLMFIAVHGIPKDPDVGLNMTEITKSKVLIPPSIMYHFQSLFLMFIYPQTRDTQSRNTRSSPKTVIFWVPSVYHTAATRLAMPWILVNRWCCSNTVYSIAHIRGFVTFPECRWHSFWRMLATMCGWATIEGPHTVNGISTTRRIRRNFGTLPLTKWHSQFDLYNG